MSIHRKGEIRVKNRDQVQSRREYSAKPQENNPETVMIVDDDVLIAKLFQTFLVGATFVVKVFTDPVKAIGWYKLHHKEVGLVFLDIQMPVLNGPQCLDKITQIKPNAKVAFVSGGADQTLIEQLLGRPQVYGFFPKPANYLELVKWSSQMLGNGSRLCRSR